MEERVNVMIVDDDRDILYMIEQICLYQNWRAYPVDGAEKAYQLLDEHKMHVVLVDYHMPRIDGVRVTREIRRRDLKIPIIALTVEENEEVFNRFLLAGANDYSVKPIKPIDLIARIQAHLKFYDRYQYYNQSEKGINQSTLDKITGKLRESGDFLDAEELQARTGINQKTLYRYLQYLQRQKLVDQQVIYGGKGRPKAHYRLK